MLRWSAIASHLPNRTDNEIKNYWNTHLKKRLEKMGIDPITHKAKSASTNAAAHGQTKRSAANLSHMTQWESARLEAEARLVRESKLLKSSTMFHGHALEPSSAASSAHSKPVALSQNLLKAWKGNWPNNVLRSSASSNSATSGISNGIGDLESPTSTLSLLENAGQPPAMGGGAIKAHNMYINDMVGGLVGKCNMEGDHGGWSSTDHEYTSNEGEPALMGFSDLLLESSEGKGEASICGVGTDDNKEEEDKDYWKSILSLVNSSSSDSPLF